MDVDNCTDMSVLISVIVPVYNVDKYLDKCIQSILSQSYTNFELLLVDDGSTDTSGDICEKYAETDHRVRVIHKKNGGVSSARNAGIDRSAGEWIAFIDADDWIYPDFLKGFIANFSYDADLYIQGYTDSGGNTLVRADRYWKSDNLIVELDDIYLDQLYNFVWNKLFKSSIIKANVLYFDPRITMLEDLWFVYSYLLHAKSVFNISQVNYYYWRHESSACFKKHSFESWNLFIERFYSLFSQCAVYNKHVASRRLKVCYCWSLDVLRSLYIDKRSSTLRIEFLKKVKKMAKENELIRSRSMHTLNNKIITFLVLNFPVVWADCLLWLANKIYSVKK